jgi:hypothetical protein
MTMTTVLGEFGVILGDIVLRSAAVLVLVTVLVLTALGVTAAASFVVEALGRS